MSSTSTQAVESAKRWLTKCLSSHESCQKRARLSTIWSSDNMHIIRDLGPGDMMPKRLLRLKPFSASQSSNGDSYHLYLEQFQKGSAVQPYVALSYCWGDPASVPKTTGANLENHMSVGLEIKTLPATFRHAAEVVRRLGYECLWIDALCIVQDDEEDWKEEAPRMAVVYGNAVCTIHAADAINSDGGLFATSLAGSKRGILQRRAWATQELAISPRSLIFTADGVGWECQQAQTTPADEYADMKPKNDVKELSEKSPKGLKDIFVFFRDWRIPGQEVENPEVFDEPRMDLSFDIQGDKHSYVPFIDTWWELISQYSSRSMSYESDRFLALNGIAAVAQRQARIRNTWGLWIDFLETELLWYVDSSGPEGHSTNRFLAPSWSWAATKGGIVKNTFAERGSSAREYASLMIKPQIGIPYGTSFDQKLPIPAWTSRDSQSIALKGDLRTGEITAYLSDDGRKRYTVKLDNVGRWSDDEIYDFRPDAPSKFPLGETKKVVCLLVWHLEAGGCGLNEHVNLVLVLRQRQEQEVRLYTDDVTEIDLMEERTFYRLGYMECSFKDMRETEDIHEDLWWKQLWLR